MKTIWNAIGGDPPALSDDIWLNLDHHENDAVAKVAQFKMGFN